MIACQMSLYPLGSDNVDQVVDDALDSLEPLRREGLTVDVASMSTVVTGPDDLVWAAVRTLFDAASRGGQPVVLTATVSNECGRDAADPGR